MNRKIYEGTIPAEVLKFVTDELQKIQNGEIIFVAQDNYFIQVEVKQRRRIEDWEGNIEDWEGNFPNEEKNFSSLIKNIQQEFAKLDYGQLAVKIQKGRVVQLERVVRQRFTGLDGEGI